MSLSLPEFAAVLVLFAAVLAGGALLVLTLRQRAIRRRLSNARQRNAAPPDARLDAATAAALRDLHLSLRLTPAPGLPAPAAAAPDPGDAPAPAATADDAWASLVAESAGDDEARRALSPDELAQLRDGETFLRQPLAAVASPVPLPPGETAVAVFAARLLDEAPPGKTVHFPLGDESNAFLGLRHGRGRRTAAELDRGPLLVTDRRLVFAGSLHPFAHPFPLVASVELFSDALRVHAADGGPPRLLAVATPPRVLLTMSRAYQNAATQEGA